MDCGPNPAAINLRKAALLNGTFRTAVWTGKHLQVTVMCIPVGESVGTEKHGDVDQLLYIEQGSAALCTGSSREALENRKQLCPGCAALVPAGTWHNVLNCGSCPLKLFSVYAPPEHPHGTVHCTKAAAEAAESAHEYS